MGEIDDIYNKIYTDISTKDPHKFLMIVDPHIEKILKLNFESEEERFKVTRLISDYALILFKRGFVKKSIKFLNHSINLFETDPKLNSTDLLNQELYISVLWCRAEANYTLKKYSDAKSDFKLLLEKFPGNDRYKNWYNASVKFQFNKIEWIFLIIVAISLILKYIIKLDNEFDFVLLVISLVGLILTKIIKYLNLKK